MADRPAPRADYDWRAFAKLLRERLAKDGRGYRVLCDVIGVTFTDLSRASSGQAMTAAKVIAMCDWMEVSFRAFYRKPAELTPAKSNCCSAPHVKQGGVKRAAGRGGMPA